MKNKKYIFTLFVIFNLNFLLVGQNIELPDLTTVISGDSLNSTSDALPSFNDVLSIPENSGNVVPLLPEVEEPSDEEVKDKRSGESGRNIFAQGQFGGGYPFLFTGNFSVFTLDNKNPFKIYFSHDQAAGYVNNSLSEGFSDRTTNLTIQKSVENKKYSSDIFASYQSIYNGLQNQLYGITGLNQNIYSLSGGFERVIKNGFSFSASGDFNFYNRYADVTEGSFSPASFLSMNPKVALKYNGYGFEAGIDAAYDFETDFDHALYAQNVHRAFVGTFVKWSGKYLSVFGDVHSLFGNQINNPVLVPFTLGLHSSIPMYFSNRPFTLSLQGGVDSFINHPYILESKYKFAVLNLTPQESSDWFGKMELSFPIKESFTANLNLEYRKTAFNNGKVQPLYDGNYGIYNFSERELEQFISDVSLAYHYKLFSIAGGWRASWLDLLVLEDAYKVFLDLNFQSQDSKWGSSISGSYALSSEDKDPYINLEAFVTLSKSVRASLYVDDFVKLVKAQPRLYAGNYITRGGSASLMMKFFF